MDTRAASASTSNVIGLFRRGRCAECERLGQCLGRGLEAGIARDALDIAVLPRLVRRGERLFHAGDPLECLYVLRSGSVKRSMTSSDGEEQVVEFHMAGDIIGLEALASGHFASDAVALDTCAVCPLPFDDLARCAQRSPELGREMYRRLAAHIEHGQLMLLMIGKKNAEGRIASFLLEQSGRQSARGYSAELLTLAMSRGDVGNYLGLAVETVSRVLTRLRASGVIEVNRNQVRLRDRSALERLAGAGRELERDPRRAAH